MNEGNGMNQIEQREHPRPRPEGYSDSYEVFRIEDGETHWCVAMTAGEALQAHGVESLGYSSVDEYKDDQGPVRIRRLYPHEKITVNYDEGGPVEKRARDWAIEHRGVFCSTVW